jgi:hypothetical protein
METFEQYCDKIENETLYDIEFKIESGSIKLSEHFIELIRRGIQEKKPFFVIVDIETDDSIELIIDNKEYIVLFRMEGTVVNARSSFIDIEGLEKFLSIFMEDE